MPTSFIYLQLWVVAQMSLCQTLKSTLLNTCLADSMASNNSPDYKALFLEAERKQKQVEECQRQAEEEQRCEAGLRRQTEEQTLPTILVEFIQYGHNIITKFLRVKHQSHCTSRKISALIGKKCPRKLHPWTECQTQQEKSITPFASILDQHKKTTGWLFTSLNATGE